MKTTRRQFLTAGAVITALPSALYAAESPPPPVGLIDCPSHLFCPELLALMEKRTVDPVVFTKDGTRFLRMGDWLLFASDHPWVEPKLIIEALRSLKLPPGQEKRILSGNARELFGISSEQ